MDYETGEDLSQGGKYIKKPGCYHLAIIECNDDPRKSNGEAITNSLLQFHAKVLAGPEPEDYEKEYSEVFFRPNADHKDGGAFTKKKCDRFLLAIGLIDPDEKGKKVKIDLTKAVGRQFFIKLSADAKSGRVGMEGAEVYHINDKDAAGFPRNTAALDLVPPELRRIDGKPAPVKGDSAQVDVAKAEDLDL